MPTSISDLQTPLALDSVRTTLTELLTGLDFPVEAWQDEGAARSLLEAQSALGVQLSSLVAELSKQGFISTATATFLDAKIQSDFDLTRNAAVASAFAVTMVNSSTTTYSGAAVAVGKIILRSSTGQTFVNTTTATLTAGTSTPLNFEAQSPGAAGNVAAQNLELVTPFAGVSAVFDGALDTAGADAEKDPPYRERARAQWGALRVEKVRAGILSLAREAAPAITAVGVDDANPRGPGTVDVYLSAANATAGAADVALVQDALNAAIFGNGDVVKLVQAIAAPTETLDLAATLYIQGAPEATVTSDATAAWRAFLETIPVGGFDFSPGPVNTVRASQIIDALSAVPGVLSAELTDPAGNVLVTPNTKVLEGAIAFTIVAVSA